MNPEELFVVREWSKERHLLEHLNDSGKLGFDGRERIIDANNALIDAVPKLLAHIDYQTELIADEVSRRKALGSECEKKNDQITQQQITILIAQQTIKRYEGQIAALKEIAERAKIIFHDQMMPMMSINNWDSRRRF